MKASVDPTLLSALSLFPPLDLSRHSLAAVRSGLTDMIAAAPPPPVLPVTVSERIIPASGGAPGVRVLEYRPEGRSDPLPVILHMHAGGYVIGAPEMMDAAHRALAVDLLCVIVSVDYRLAPETRFPGGIEDCYAVLAWLVRNAEAIGIDPARIGVKGESAGGGLAAALALMARDRGEFPLAFQHLHYPMLDDRTLAQPQSSDLVWSAEQNAFGWQALLGQAPGQQGVSIYAAAGRATDLTALPPTFMTLGAIDVLALEGIDYANRLMQAGVPVELHVFPGAFHAFDIAPDAESAITARALSHAALRRVLGQA